MIELVHQKTPFSIGSIAIDAIVTEKHRRAGEATQHPVEDGSDISDHYRTAPRLVELEGVITDMPLDAPRSHANNTRKTKSPIELANEVFGMQLGPIPISILGSPQMGAVDTFLPEFTRVEDTFAEFEALFDKGKVVSIVTSLKIYENMALLDLMVDKKGNSYEFTCAAQQIRVVVSGKAAAFVLPVPARAKPKVDKGKQEPAPVENKAVLAKIVDHLLGH